MIKASTDRFAPLEEQELEAAGPNRTSDDDRGMLVTPIPWDAPSAPQTHARYGAAVAHWHYQDAGGSDIFHVVRFQPADAQKVILPQTLWRTSDDKLAWHWKAVPSPRPLYGLAILNQKQGSLVIVTEGEKAADAAQSIFPDAVVVTSSGGSSASTQSDWSPLTGRKVLIWPDFDEPGRKYADAVGQILIGHDCDVAIVDAEELVSIDPVGGRREPIPGWDAADAAVDWADAMALRAAVERATAPYKSPPAYVSYGAYRMNPSGLYCQVRKGRGDKAPVVDEWVAAPIELLGASRDPSGGCWGKLLSWNDGDGRVHTRHVSDASLQGDPAQLCAVLAGDGLKINRSQQKALISYLAGSEPKDRVTVVSRTGWHQVAGQRVFVLPQQSFGASSAEKVILDGAAVGPYSASGSLGDWQSSIGALVDDHVLPKLVVSIALAGPLLHLAGQEGGGVHIHGQSSRGKTTLLQIAASVWGRGGTPGYVRSWRTTANGLEGAAASASDTLLVLDELGMVEAREAGAAIYGLSNGAGKQRANRTGDLRDPKTWRVITLSTGEIPIAIKIQENKGSKIRGGQMIRMIDLAADRGLGFGVFDHRGDSTDAAVLANQCKQAAVDHFGTAGPEFVRRLIRQDVTGNDIGKLIAKFLDEHVPAGAEGQVHRAANRFGLFAAAGELGIGLDVLPWEQGSAWQAASWAFQRFIEGRGGAGSAEELQAIAQVRHFLVAHGVSRFEDMDADRPEHGEPRPVLNRVGWRRGTGALALWMIPDETWRSDLCEGLDPKFVAGTLNDRGFLEAGSDSLKTVRKIEGVSRRVYVINATLLENSSDES